MIITAVRRIAIFTDEVYFHNTWGPSNVSCTIINNLFARGWGRYNVPPPELRDAVKRPLFMASIFMRPNNIILL